MIQNGRHSIPYELKARDVERRLFTCCFTYIIRGLAQIVAMHQHGQPLPFIFCYQLVELVESALCVPLLIAYECVSTSKGIAWCTAGIGITSRYWKMAPLISRWKNRTQKKLQQFRMSKHNKILRIKPNCYVRKCTNRCKE